MIPYNVCVYVCVRGMVRFVNPSYAVGCVWLFFFSFCFLENLTRQMQWKNPIVKCASKENRECHTASAHIALMLNNRRSVAIVNLSEELYGIANGKTASSATFHQPNNANFQNVSLDGFVVIMKRAIANPSCGTLYLLLLHSAYHNLTIEQRFTMNARV